MPPQATKYQLSAEKMDEALLFLLQKKDFEFITVKEICEKAGVNRSTFYLHYETIDDLLREAVAHAERRFYENFSDENHFADRLRDCDRSELYLITPGYLRPYLEFIKENQTLYRAFVEKPKVFRVDKTLEAMFSRIFDPILERFSVPESERKYRMAFYLSGVAAVTGIWLRNGCAEPIDEMVKIIRSCVPGLPGGNQKEEVR